ncbi:IS21-like element helper ATPase IstB [Ideonella paludis]
MSSMQQTLNQLRDLRLSVMADALQQQVQQPRLHELAFEERLALLVDQEWSERQSRKMKRLIRVAGLPEMASLEELDSRPNRGLDKAAIASLATCDWMRRQQNLIILGATGVGKTWLACAFANQACRSKLTVKFSRASELIAEIATASLDGSLPKLKLALAKPTLLVIDDLGLGQMTANAAQVLLDIVDRRMRTGALLITSQYPSDQWHAMFPDPTVADAILDRVVHQAHRLQLKGESMRKVQAKAKMKLPD